MFSTCRKSLHIYSLTRQTITLSVIFCFIHMTPQNPTHPPTPTANMWPGFEIKNKKSIDSERFFLFSSETLRCASELFLKWPSAHLTPASRATPAWWLKKKERKKKPTLNHQSDVYVYFLGIKLTCQPLNLKVCPILRFVPYSCSPLCYPVPDLTSALHYSCRQKYFILLLGPDLTH